MCDPATIIAGSSLAIGVVSDIQRNRSQRKQADAVRDSAHSSASQQIAALSERGIQEQDSASMSILAADRSARLAKATAAVSAGESGVSGQSVDAVLHDLQRQGDEYRTGTRINLDNTLTQLDSEKAGVRAQEQSVIAGAPFPSDLATGISIAGRGLDFADQILIRKPTKKSS